MTTISDGLEARGWRVTPVDERNRRVADIPPNGDAQWTRDGVILSLSNGSLCRYKGATSYYAEPGIVLNAILVPNEERGKGLGSRALTDLVESAREAAQGRELILYCEACNIGGLPKSSNPMTDEQLGAWYQRAGFTRDEKRSDERTPIYSLVLGRDG